MALIDRPWARVRQPTLIPPTWSPKSLAAMEDISFAELLRSQLMVRDQSLAGRREWSRLWSELGEDEQLATRSYDVLEDFLDTTQQALSKDDVDPAERERAVKFEQQCQHAWNRLDRGEATGPLAWAGDAGKFPPSAGRVIATLIAAIARHRSAVQRLAASEARPVDEELWSAMRQVNLDPSDYPR